MLLLSGGFTLPDLLPGQSAVGFQAAPPPKIRAVGPQFERSNWGSLLEGLVRTRTVWMQTINARPNNKDLPKWRVRSQ